MSNFDFPELTIQSHRGVYRVHFGENLNLASHISLENFFIIDKKLVDLHATRLKPFLQSGRALLLDAVEENKDLQKISDYIETLISLGIKRNHRLIAIGGGIVQDITCFISSCLFRGLVWSFIPTTLLAQADSCIGSKSSINVKSIKNLVGNFNPPEKIIVDVAFLETLSRQEIYSGIGEMLKVHIIAGEKQFLDISLKYEEIFKSKKVLIEFIIKSLQIKKEIIEIDEFDQNERLVMNFGHTFGHAIESATGYQVPHGIAVTIGMDLACEYAYRLKRISESQKISMQNILRKNAKSFLGFTFNYEEFSSSISKDKKNQDQMLALILPKKNGGVERLFVEKDDQFHTICKSYFSEIKSVVI